MTLVIRKFLCIIILIVLGAVGMSRCLANPLPSDAEYGGNPIPADQETPVYLKEEFVNISLTSSKAFVSAFYTFKNNDSSPIEISIILPFKDLSKKSNDYKDPEDHVRILNSTNFTYEWKDINLEGIVEYGGDEYKAIEFQLSFSGNEEKEVWIYYSRDYLIYKDIETLGLFGSKIHYSYEYLVGTARAWNHPIELAKFQFNLPKSICDHVPAHSDRNMTFNENDEFFVGKIEYLDWIPETDIISVNWNDNRSLVVHEWNVLVLMINVIGGLIFLVVSGLIILKIKRRK